VTVNNLERQREQARMALVTAIEEAASVGYALQASRPETAYPDWLRRAGISEHEANFYAAISGYWTPDMRALPLAELVCVLTGALG
jgi:hypothetical protein